MLIAKTLILWYAVIAIEFNYVFPKERQIVRKTDTPKQTN